MNPQTVRRSRRRLLLLAALFLLPPVTAYFLYFVAPGLIPKARVNRGELIDPARPLPADLKFRSVDGKHVTEPWKNYWTVLMFGGDACDAGCAHRVQLMRNLRRVLRHNAERTQVVYLAPDAAALSAASATLRHDAEGFRRMAPDGGSTALRRFFADADRPGAIVLIDPLGNWVLAYGPQAPPKDIYLDLKRLLRYSQIG